jgi:hypothetical protein
MQKIPRLPFYGRLLRGNRCPSNKNSIQQKDHLMFNAVRRRAARLVVITSAAAIATAPAVVAHAQPPIRATVIIQSIERPEDIATGAGVPLAGVTVQATDAAANIEDECVTDTNGRCTLDFASEGNYSICITDVPDIYERESGACVRQAIVAGTSHLIFLFLAPAEENGDGDGDNGNGGNGNNGDENGGSGNDGDGNDGNNGDVSDDEDEVTNSGDHDNINTGSGQNCSVTNTNDLSVLSPTIVDCVNAPGRSAG